MIITDILTKNAELYGDEVSLIEVNPEIQERIDKANEEGPEIYCDVYPYIATHTSASVRFVPDSGQNLFERLADETERAKMKEWGRARWEDDLSWLQDARLTRNMRG